MAEFLTTYIADIAAFSRNDGLFEPFLGDKETDLAIYKEQEFLVLDIDRQTGTILKVFNPK